MPFSPIFDFSAFLPDLTDWAGFILTAAGLVTPEGDQITAAEVRHLRWLLANVQAENRRLKQVQPLGVVLTLEELGELRRIVNLLEAKLPERLAAQRSRRG